MKMRGNLKIKGEYTVIGNVVSVYGKEGGKQLKLAWEDFRGEDHCRDKCEFYNTCRANRERCPKRIFAIAVCTLAEAEEAAIKLSYGFCDNKRYSMQEIGECLNLTPVQVRQVMAKAIRKLRHPARRSRILKVSSDCYAANVDFYKNLIAEVYGQVDQNV